MYRQYSLYNLYKMNKNRTKANAILALIVKKKPF